MKKLTIFLPIIAFFLVLCSEAPELPAPTNRTVLAEFFTDDGWPICASAEQALDSLKKLYGDSLAIISYNHTLCPAAIADERANLYGFPVYPTVVFDGTDEVFEPNPDSLLTTYDDHIQAAKADTPQYNLELTATATPNAGNLQLNIVTADTIPVGEIFTYIAICQDSIHGFLMPYFNYVCQQMYSFPLDLVHPDTLDTTIAFNHSIPVGQMSAIIFIQNMNTKKIMHAITKDFEEVQWEY